MKKFSPMLLVPVLGVFSTPVPAGEAEVRAGLKQLDPAIPVESVTKSVIDGLYEVAVGGDIYYVSKDGKYIVSGNIFEAKTRKNLTEAARGKIYLKAVNDAGESGMIIYEPKSRPRRTLTVFTDVDCPYCRKFHRDLPDHLEKGIRVRYVMIPLRGLNTDTYGKSVSVWCGKDRNRALDIVKGGGKLEQEECPNPLLKNLALARELGIDGTPTILTDRGQLYRGYVPKDDLHARMGLPSPIQAEN